MKSHICVVSPHLDDETLGCGGTLLKYKSMGYKISLILVTNLNNDFASKNNIIQRKKNIAAIKKKYNINKLFELKFKTTEIDTYPKNKIIFELKKCLDMIQPEKIFAPSANDIHTDHKIISECLKSCVKIFRSKYIKQVLFYEVLSETNLNFDNNFNPNFYVNITNFLKMKIKIALMFKGEIKKHPFPRSVESIKSLAILRGSESGYKYSEAFRVYFERLD